MKKQKKKKSEEVEYFTASNGVVVEFAHDPEADIPPKDEELDALFAQKPIDINTLLFPEEQQAFSEFAAHKTRGRPRSTSPKRLMSFKFSPDIISAIKATGKGYTTRVEALLRQALAEGRI